MKNHFKCCIVGGGPAGIMLGYIMAKFGVEVVVLEKHNDFFRDFRGDTIHPSTMKILNQLGILDDFLKIPHDNTDKLTAVFGNKEITIADFSRLNILTPYIAFTPQWNFLNFLAEKGNELPNFHLMMDTEAVDLVKENGRITGVKARKPSGELTIYSDFVVGTDGRHSMTRDKAQFKVHDLGSPIDVLWFKIVKTKTNIKHPFINVNNGGLVILIDRNDYFQCGYLLLKGGYQQILEKGLSYFQQEVISIIPELKNEIMQITSMEDVKKLDIKVDRLEQWYTEGLICIGDAAHAMSPIGGVGVNLAIQDAVATANILVPVLRNGVPTLNDLRKIQKRRMYPTKFTQFLQVLIQNKSLQPFLSNKKKQGVPSLFRLFQWFPFLRVFPAKVIGVGIRSEKIELK
ncbi:MAG: FAD-dependent oxidoreductase [Gelidibacter sp.]